MSERVRIPASQIIREVAYKHGVTVADLCGPRRFRHLAHARQEACWTMRRHTKLSYPAIAARVGLADHTSALYGERAHERRMAEEASLSTSSEMCVDRPWVRRLAASCR